jgi:hypothetical protein
MRIDMVFPCVVTRLHSWIDVSFFGGAIAAEKQKNN